MKSIVNPSARIFLVFFFLVSMFSVKPLDAHHPAHFRFYVITTDSVYSRYQLISMTDSSINIQSPAKAGAQMITLPVSKIIEIKAERKGFRIVNYVAPVLVGAAAGYLATPGLNTDAPEGALINPNRLFKYAGIYTGMACGLVAGVVIDASRFHTYAINTRVSGFIPFRNHWQ